MRDVLLACAGLVLIAIAWAVSGLGVLVRANDICAEMCEDSTGHAFTGLDRDYFECVCAPGGDEE